MAQAFACGRGQSAKGSRSVAAHTSPLHLPEKDGLSLQNLFFLLY